MTVKTRSLGDLAGFELMSMLSSAYPKLAVVDCSFPLRSLSWFHDDVVSAVLSVRFGEDLEAEFYTRFRQAGGHLPLIAIPELRNGGKTRLSFLREPGKVLAIAFRESEWEAVLEGISDFTEDTLLLVQVSADGDSFLRACTTLGFYFSIFVHLSRNRDREKYILVSKNGFSTATVERLIAGAKRFAIDVEVDNSDEQLVQRSINVKLAAVGSKPKSASFAAATLVHDGNGRSETKDGYSWMWVGRERHVRFVLGRVPHHYRSVRVVIPNALPASNLFDARLLLNGEVKASTVEKWEESAGAISTDLVPFPGEQILGFAVPAIKILPDGVTTLSACIDRIEFFS